MSGWLVLYNEKDEWLKYETPGESRIEVATNGPPKNVAFTTEGIVRAEWSAEEPEPSGPQIGEAEPEPVEEPEAKATTSKK